MAGLMYGRTDLAAGLCCQNPFCVGIYFCARILLMAEQVLLSRTHFYLPLQNPGHLRGCQYRIAFFAGSKHGVSVFFVGGFNCLGPARHARPHCQLRLVLQLGIARSTAKRHQHPVELNLAGRLQIGQIPDRAQFFWQSTACPRG